MKENNANKGTIEKTGDKKKNKAISGRQKRQQVVGGGVWRGNRTKKRRLLGSQAERLEQMRNFISDRAGRPYISPSLSHHRV